MTIEELAEAESIVRSALELDKVIDVVSRSEQANRAAWTLAKAWLADGCSEDLVVSTVTEDDGTIE